MLAEPAASRVAAAVADAAGCQVEEHRRPPDLSPLFQDLRTFSLFAAAKVLLVVDSAVLADRAAAAELIDDAAEALPLPAQEGRELAPRERQAASRLLQALGLFDVNPYAGTVEEAVGSLPAWALEGGARGGGRGGRRGKKGVEELCAGLAALLAAARRENLQGWGGGALAELGRIAREGLPPGHTLVLAERSVATGHPLVEQLAERGAVLKVGQVQSGKVGEWEGLDDLAEELARQTEVEIARDALAELARRTLQGAEERRGKGAVLAGADSSARFAGEYRKLAEMARGAGSARIDRRLVQQAVEDRGEEDVWKLLDAIGEGRGEEALDRLARLLATAEDAMAARLSLLSLLATFCRQLTAVRGMMRLARVPAGESNPRRFEQRWAKAMQADLDLPGEWGNPIAKLHPFRLFKLYAAASRMPEAAVARLPAEVLETELRMKGESGEADVALAHLVARLASAARAGERGAGR